jgi:hypothetical protein
MAAAKKQRASSKVESSEEKIKGNALFFMQGHQMIWEGLDWLEFAQKLGGLSDEEKLTKLAELAQFSKTPKVSIRTFSKDEEGKVTDVHHTNVPLMAEGGGKYRMTVPDLFPRDGAEKYLINDLLFYVDSFTKDDHIAWETWSEEQGLTELFAKQTAVRRNIRSVVPTDDEIDSVRQEIPGLEQARQTLQEKQKAAYADLDLDDDAVTKISARLKLTNTRIKELRTQLYVWENESDPLELAKKTQPMTKELEGLEAEVNCIFMTFVHDYALRNSMTSLTLDEWLEQADEQDYSNAIQWVASGNARRMLGRIARPITREEERARELHKVLN